MSAIEYVNDDGALAYQPAASDGARLARDVHGYETWEEPGDPVLYRSRRKAERRAASYERTLRATTWRVNT